MNANHDPVKLHILIFFVETSLKELEELGVVNPIAGTPQGDKFFDSLARKIKISLNLYIRFTPEQYSHIP